MAGTALVLTSTHAGAQVRINEVLANNVSVADGGIVSDWIELYNTSPTPVDLSGASLSDNTAAPQRFVFPAGTSIGANGYLTVRFDSTSPASPNNTGFGLKASGGAVYLFNRLSNGGTVIDSVSYGLQAVNLSIGRTPNGSGDWSLNTPSPRQANTAAALGSSADLKVNEWMAQARNGESDYFEIYNGGDRPVLLSGLTLTDDLINPAKYTIPALSFIGTGTLGAYSLFIADDNTAAGADHVGFSLRAGGEAVGIYDRGVAIDTVSFGNQSTGVSEGRSPDGSTTILKFTTSPTPGAPNYALAKLTEIVINELLTHTDPPLEDAIEFRNTTDQPINMKGWMMIATEVREPGSKQFTFTTDFIVPARGYRVLYEVQFTGSDELRFNAAHGGEIKLYQTDASGTYLSFTTRSYEPAQNGFSFGRHETSDGSDWVTLETRTFGIDKPSSNVAFRKGNGLPNSGPRIGPVVINEIHYHPPDLGTNDNSVDEFIELRNITSKPVPLYDPITYRSDKNYLVNGTIIRAGSVYAEGRTNTWHLEGDVEFNFPTNISIPAEGYLLLVNFDPVTNTTQLAAFRTRFPGLPANVTVLGPYSGKLNNSGATLELQRPDFPQGPNHPKDFQDVPYFTAERLKYKDTLPWPPEADGTGSSLQRRKAVEYGNEPLNWKAAVPSPGVRNAEPPIITTAPQNVAYIAGDDAGFTVIATGSAPLIYQWTFKGTNLAGATNATLLLQNLQPAHIGTYGVTVRNDEGSASAEAILRLDSVKPILTVTTPKPNIRWSNDTIVVQGTVRDDFGVSEVLVRLNSGAFQPVTGTSNWSSQLNLTPGTNVIQVKALDLARNASPTNTLRVIFVVTSPLTLTVNGGGSVAPNLNGKLLEVGSRYTLTATPTAGNLFSNWSGGLVSAGNPLSFAMESNLVLQANFVPNPFLASKGVYNGLFHDTTAVQHQSSGFVTLTVGDSGSFSGSLLQGTKKYPFSGKFDLDGRATNRVSFGGTNSAVVALQLSLGLPVNQVTGNVRGPLWEAELAAELTGFTTAAPMPHAGSYTLLLPGSEEPEEPGGDGYGTATLSPVGLVAFNGMLADGTKAAHKVAVGRSGQWPFYVGLYSGKGAVMGWLRFEGTSPSNRLSGNVSWIKPALSSAKIYPSGFAVNSATIGSRFTPPTAGSRTLDLTNATLTLSGGNLAARISSEIELTADNKILNRSTNKLTLTIAPASGLISGSFTDPATGKSVPFKGAVLENERRGSGYFLGTNSSGRVRLMR